MQKLLLYSFYIKFAITFCYFCKMLVINLLGKNSPFKVKRNYVRVLQFMFLPPYYNYSTLKMRVFDSPCRIVNYVKPRCLSFGRIKFTHNENFVEKEPVRTEFPLFLAFYMCLTKSLKLENWKNAYYYLQKWLDIEGESLPSAIKDDLFLLDFKSSQKQNVVTQENTAIGSYKEITVLANAYLAFNSEKITLLHLLYFEKECRRAIERVDSLRNFHDSWESYDVEVEAMVFFLKIAHRFRYRFLFFKAYKGVYFFSGGVKLFPLLLNIHLCPLEPNLYSQIEILLPYSLEENHIKQKFYMCQLDIISYYFYRRGLAFLRASNSDAVRDNHNNFLKYYSSLIDKGKETSLSKIIVQSYFNRIIGETQLLLGTHDRVFAVELLLPLLDKRFVPLFYKLMDFHPTLSKLEFLLQEANADMCKALLLRPDTALTDYNFMKKKGLRINCLTFERLIKALCDIDFKCCFQLFKYYFEGSCTSNCIYTASFYNEKPFKVRVHPRRGTFTTLFKSALCFNASAKLIELLYKDFQTRCNEWRKDEAAPTHLKQQWQTCHVVYGSMMVSRLQAGDFEGVITLYHQAVDDKNVDLIVLTCALKAFVYMEDTIGATKLFDGGLSLLSESQPSYTLSDFIAQTEIDLQKNISTGSGSNRGDVVSGLKEINNLRTELLSLNYGNFNYEIEWDFNIITPPNDDLSKIRKPAIWFDLMILLYKGCPLEVSFYYNQLKTNYPFYCSSYLYSSFARGLEHATLSDIRLNYFSESAFCEKSFKCSNKDSGYNGNDKCCSAVNITSGMYYFDGKISLEPELYSQYPHFSRDSNIFSNDILESNKRKIDFTLLSLIEVLSVPDKQR